MLLAPLLLLTQLLLLLAPLLLLLAQLLLLLLAQLLLARFLIGMSFAILFLNCSTAHSLALRPLAGTHESQYFSPVPGSRPFQATKY